MNRTIKEGNDMNVIKIIEELKNKQIIQPLIKEFDILKGGTTSQIFLLYDDSQPLYVIKLNDAITLEAETKFLKFYNHVELLPRLIYVDPLYRYIVYTFINGETNYPTGNKQSILQTLVKDFIHFYQPIKHNGFGYMDEPVQTWTEFLRNSATESKNIIGAILSEEDHHFILQLIDRNRLKERGQYLLHGDCGIHNFIFYKGHLHGIIDPTPIIGDPIYDLIYAFCSSPDDLTVETLKPAIDLFHKKMLLPRKYDNIYEEVIIGLYLRIASCIKHHPYDLDKYLSYWNYWKNLVS